jgi:hypothetical protein
MFIFKPAQLNVINIIITLVVMDDFSINDINRITEYMAGLIYHHLRKFFFLWRKTIIKPIILEFVPIPSKQTFLPEMA